jgi:hypothetical protein
LDNNNEINDCILEDCEDYGDVLEHIDPLFFATQMRDQISMINEQNKREVIQLASTPPFNTDPHFLNYVKHSDQMFTIIETKGGEDYIDKLFHKFTQDEYAKHTKNYPFHKYFNQINIVNMDNIDVFSLLKQLGKHVDEILLSELLLLLEGMGVKRVIFVDLTCSKLCVTE